MNRDEWLATRRLGIGGSDTPAILGVDPWRTARDVAMEKLGLTEDSEPTPDMKRGTAVEPLAAKWFEEQTGIKIVRPKEQSVEHPEYPFLRASFDRVTPKRDTLIEIKCPRVSTYLKARREGIPANYSSQLQHYLMWPKFRRGVFVVFSVELWEGFYVEQEPDRELQGLIVEHDRTFWETISRGEIPEEPEVPLIDLPPTSGEVMKLETPEWSVAVDNFREAREILAEAKEFEESAKQEIVRLMNGSEVVEGFDLRVYNQLQKGRESWDIKRAQKEHPEIEWGKYRKVGEPFRTIKPYFLRGAVS